MHAFGACGQVVALVMVRITPQEMYVSLCNVLISQVYATPEHPEQQQSSQAALRTPFLFPGR